MERVGDPARSDLDDFVDSLEESGTLLGLNLTENTLTENSLKMRARARAHARRTVGTPFFKTNEHGESDAAVRPKYSGKRIDLGQGSVAWGPCYIGDGTILGNDISVGCLTHIGREVEIGNRTRIQGGAYIADRCTVAEDVFIGPNATLLNDRYPPSRDSNYWQPVTVQKNAIIGGGVTILPGLTIGVGAVIAAGAVVTSDVPAAEVWAGVPATKMMTRAEYSKRGSDYRSDA